MGIRSFLEKNKSWTVPLVLILAAGVIVVSLWHTSRSNSLSQPMSKGFFTVDGNTYFVDDLTKRTPFDHSGQQAYRAYVFQGADGKPFVGLMGRNVASPNVPLDPRVSASSQSLAIEVKKPSDKNWVSLNGSDGQRLIQSIVQSGHNEAVLPE